MDRDELRKKMIAGIDRVLGFGRLVSSEQRKILRATKAAVVANDSVVDAVLAELEKSAKK